MFHKPPHETTSQMVQTYPRRSSSRVKFWVETSQGFQNPRAARRATYGVSSLLTTIADPKLIQVHLGLADFLTNTNTYSHLPPATDHSRFPSDLNCFGVRHLRSEKPRTKMHSVCATDARKGKNSTTSGASNRSTSPNPNGIRMWSRISSM